MDRKALPPFLGDKDKHGEVTEASAHRRLLRLHEKEICHRCGKVMVGETVIVRKPGSPFSWCEECW